MYALKTYLQQFPHYNPSVYEAVLPFLTEKILLPGEFLLRGGSVSRHIAFIEQGLVRQYYLKNGKEVTHCFCRENMITTAHKSFVTQQGSDLFIQAIEETKLGMLSYTSLQQLFAKDLFWQQVGRMVTEKELIISESHHRLINDFSARERYLEVLHNDRELLQRVPLNYLASYLQIAPETLSRIRKKISRT